MQNAFKPIFLRDEWRWFLCAPPQRIMQWHHNNNNILFGITSHPQIYCLYSLYSCDRHTNWPSCVKNVTTYGYITYVFNIYFSWKNNTYVNYRFLLHCIEWILKDIQYTNYQMIIIIILFIVNCTIICVHTGTNILYIGTTKIMNKSKFYVCNKLYYIMIELKAK